MDWFLYDNGLRHVRVKKRVLIVRFIIQYNSRINLIMILRIIHLVDHPIDDILVN